MPVIPNTNVPSLDRADLVELKRFIGSAQAMLRAFDIRLGEALNEPALERLPAWLPVAEAAERFKLKPDSLRLLCRRQPGIGRRVGGRWEVDTQALRRRLGLG